jgi:soluble lytic murein transglycosylase-like protein
MKYGLIALCLGLLLMVSLPARAFCFEAAGARYRIDPRLLKAIAMQESGLNPKAINVNRDKQGRPLSTDYGVMQINSVHIPGLIRMGIIKRPEDLLTNPCLNVQTGAWILAKHLQVCGVNWGCLGSYNAGLADNKRQEARRMQYARRIYGIYLKMVRGDA